jgi:hypothetical protein
MNITAGVILAVILAIGTILTISDKNKNKWER